MDMNPVILGPDAPFVHKDAIFFSGHKFVGGPGCAGVLVVKRKVPNAYLLYSASVLLCCSDAAAAAAVLLCCCFFTAVALLLCHFVAVLLYN